MGRGAFAVCICLSASVSADPDSEGCKDIFVTRLAGFHILQCSVKTFDALHLRRGDAEGDASRGPHCQ
jgi:hypothetical protein